MSGGGVGRERRDLNCLFSVYPTLDTTTRTRSRGAIPSIAVYHLLRWGATIVKPAVDVWHREAQDIVYESVYRCS